MRQRKRTALFALPVLTLAAVSSASVIDARAGHPAVHPGVVRVHGDRLQQANIDWQAVARALGKSGQLMPGDVYRVGLPWTDLAVTVEGVPVSAGFALGSYAAFKQLEDDSTMVMGDLVLLDEEVPAVMDGLIAAGLSVTALHNHLNQVAPHVMYLHYMGHGDAVQLATALHQALSASGTLFGDSPPPTLDSKGTDTSQLEAILGHSGMLTGSTFAVSVPRAEPITEMGVPLLPAMGVTTALNFQLLPDGQAAITGDFVLLGSEVDPVAMTLRANGIEVTAIHSHALGDEPRLFYLHFWATGDALTLASALRAALDQTNSQSESHLAG